MDGWVMGGRQSRVKDCLTITQPQNNYGTGWVDRWMGGRQSRVKDCLQQSKRLHKNTKGKINKFLIEMVTWQELRLCDPFEDYLKLCCTFYHNMFKLTKNISQFTK